MQVFIVEKNHAGQRLDKFLHKYLPEASNSFIYKMLRKKNITLNGKKAEGKEILQIDDEIKCFFSEETFAKFSETAPASETVDSSEKTGGEKPSDPSEKEKTPEKKAKNRSEENSERKMQNRSEENSVKNAKPHSEKNSEKKSEKKQKKDSAEMKAQNNPSEKKPKNETSDNKSKNETSDKKMKELPSEKPKKDNKPAKSANNKGGVSEYKNAFEVLSEENIKVIYEDDNILIVNKPAGVLTQKAEPGDVSLNEWMIGYLLEHGRMREDELRLFKPSVCNRLDRNTSGLVLCGVSLAGTQKLNELIKNRSIRKYYRTICVGEINNPGVLEGSLTKDTKKNKVTIEEDGEEIKTAYTPIQKLDQQYTYLEVELITGKTHQIRAHLASIEHALVGDTKYGNPDVNKHFQKKYKLDNQLLHAYRLEFPVLNGVLENISEMVFLAPLPKEFKAILKDLR